MVSSNLLSSQDRYIVVKINIGNTFLTVFFFLLILLILDPVQGLVGSCTLHGSEGPQ